MRDPGDGPARRGGLPHRGHDCRSTKSVDNEVADAHRDKWPWSHSWSEPQLISVPAGL